MSTALLIIDVQNAFFDGVHTPPIADAGATIARQAQLVARARAAGTPVIFIRHGEPDSEFHPGSDSWQLHPALGVTAADPVIDKTRPDSFFETDLADRLAALGATRLILAGNQTEYCVNSTARAAAARGFDVTVVADAHGTFDGDTAAARIIADHNAALANGIATVQPSDQVAF